MNYFLAALKKYADFKGRARRSEYWYFVLFVFIIAIVVGILSVLIKLPILYTIFILSIIVPGIAVAVRRMHDVGKSGWYSLIPIYSLILAFTEGTPGTNEYGPDPKQPEGHDEIQSIGVIR